MHGTQEAINKNNVLNEHCPFLHLKSYFLNKTQQSLLIQPCWCHLSLPTFPLVLYPAVKFRLLSFPKCITLSLETFAPAVPLYARLFSPAPLLLCLGNSSCSFRYQFRGLLFQKVFLGLQNELDRLITPCDFHCGNTTGLSLLQSRGITRSIMVFVKLPLSS